jgi:hypothetical protein
MKKIVFLLALLPLVSFASVDMTRIPVGLFIPDPQTDLDRITVKNEALKRRLVRYLFDHDLLNHEHTRAFSLDAQFDTYFKVAAASYRLIDMDRDDIPELVFDGYVSKDDEKEHVEIYRTKNGVPEKIYDDIGHIAAYKLQPNTKEILLFHHRYPCCQNASHNLNRLRLVGGKMQLVKRYFAAREAGDMKGKFFPEKTTFNAKFRETKKDLTLRWSGSVITQNAWTMRTPENIVARYDKGAVYKVLAEENNWYFVLVHASPKQEQNKVINPANFVDTWIYGWIDKRKL